MLEQFPIFACLDKENVTGLEEIAQQIEVKKGSILDLFNYPSLKKFY